MIQFVIMGEPQGKGRPRFARSGRTYTPEKTAAYEKAAALAYKRRYQGKSFEKGVPLEMRIRAYCKGPQSASKAKRADMLSGMIRPTKTPDADNIAKIICDALNGVAYHDDAQIVSTTIEKWYAAVPRVEVSIREIGTVNNNGDTKNQGGIENV